MLYNNLNIKWLHKPSAIQSDDQLLHDDFLRLPLVCLHQPLLGVEAHNHDHRASLTPKCCQFAFILVLESIVQISRWRSLQINLQLLLCDEPSHCQQTPTHSQEHIDKLKFICIHLGFSLVPDHFVNMAKL